MALAISTITNAIAALSISGVTIKDIDELPVALRNRELPLLIPDPNGLVTNFASTIDSMGQGTDRKWTIAYNLNYVLISAQVGQGRTATIEGYGTLVNNIATVLDAIYSTTTITGALDFVPTISDSFFMEDGGANFHAVRIALTVSEFVN
jgi:hypothetical protein